MIGFVSYTWQGEGRHEGNRNQLYPIKLTFVRSSRKKKIRLRAVIGLIVAQSGYEFSQIMFFVPEVPIYSGILFRTSSTIL